MSRYFNNGFGSSFDRDTLFEEAVRVAAQYDRASASLLQRRLSIGYARAARLLDQLEDVGILGPAEGAVPRDVLIRDAEEFLSGKIHAKPRQLSRKDDPETVHLTSNPSLKNLPKESEFRKVAEQSKLETKEYQMLVGLKGEDPVYLDLKDTGNLLLVGASYSGKEAMLDTVILSLIYQKTGLNTKFLFADTANDLALYNTFPHMLTTSINSSDKFMSALKWTLAEMDRRNKIFIEQKTRTYEGYNQKNGKNLPRILFVIKNTEDFLYSDDEAEVLRVLVSNGNKAGIHLLLVTDRLYYKNVPISIKSNIPNRIIFRTTSKGDSSLAEVKDADMLSSKSEFILRLLSKSDRRLSTITVSEDDIKKTLKA